jgi:hypothetical protein
MLFPLFDRISDFSLKDGPERPDGGQEISGAGQAAKMI